VAQIPELAVQGLKRFCEDRIPEHVLDKIRIEMTARGSSLTIWECRPPWRPAAGSEWTRQKIAQLRYDAEHLTWTVFWADRNGKWLKYPGLPPTANLDRVIQELDDEPHACFWG
jgi:hypothetical protein